MDDKLVAYAAKVARLLMEAQCSTEALVSRDDVRESFQTKERSFLGITLPPRKIVTREVVSTAVLSGWYIYNELTWYEEKHYSGKMAITYSEEEQRTQVALTSSGNLVQRYVTTKLLVPGSGPYVRSDDFQPLSDSDVAFFDQPARRHRFRRRESSYRAEGWSLLPGSFSRKEAGEGLSRALTQLRKERLGH